MSAKVLLLIVLALVVSFIFPIFALPLSVFLIFVGIFIYRRSDNPSMRRMGIATMSIGAVVLIGFVALLLLDYGAQGHAVFGEGILTEPVLLPEVTPTP
ncbi:MAG: hypothetical protein HY741_14275 [Chloroflexi bacterium]|nr:hypothetical protein [Chloroflexota bacterium]